jgi:hypothetical protein
MDGGTGLVGPCGVSSVHGGSASSNATALLAAAAPEASARPAKSPVLTGCSAWRVAPGASTRQERTFVPPISQARTGNSICTGASVTDPIMTRALTTSTPASTAIHHAKNDIKISLYLYCPHSRVLL